MATTYYVSPNGLDSQSGTSPGQAWQTLAQVNAAPLQPGDSVLLEGGQTFAGNLSFAAPRLGSTAQPIYLGSYGTDRATIDAGTGPGIYVEDGAGFEIAHLRITGAGRATNPESGIHFYTETYRLTRHEPIFIHDVEVSGFNAGGITVEANEDSAWYGYAHITITDAVAHDNGDHGIMVVGRVLPAGYCHEHIYIARCTAYNNLGQLGKTQAHTGNGIVVGCAQDVLIEHSYAYGNGSENLYDGGGPVGIWLWDTRDGTIQYSESHHNRTGSSKDGGGFDIDGGCVNCLLQYNYSHDNDGAGYLVAEYPNARPLRDCTIRYNISENDGRANGYGGIMLWRGPSGILSNLRIHNNVIYTGPLPSSQRPYAFQSISSQIDSVLIANNIFITAGNARLLYLSHGPNQGTRLTFQQNCYYHIGGSPYFYDRGNTYNSLSAWRSGRGQELLNGNPTGWQTDPLLVAPGNGGTIGNPFLLPSLSAYHLQASSPLIDQGLDLTSLYGLDPGPHDFFLNSLALASNLDVGAHETSNSSFDIVLPADPGAGAPLADHLRLIPEGPRQWTLQADSSYRPWLRLRLLDAAGRTLDDHPLPPAEHPMITLPDTAPAGNYFLILIGQKGSFVRRLHVVD